MMVPRSFAHSQLVREGGSTKKPKSRKSSPMNSRPSSPRNSLSIPLSQEKPPSIQVLKEKERSKSDSVVKAKETKNQKQDESRSGSQLRAKIPSSLSSRSVSKLLPNSSAPVVIPVKRIVPGDSRRVATERMIPRNIKSRNGHDHSAIPPAVAALLAGTSIPPPKGRHIPKSHNSSSLPRHVSMEHLQKEWRKESGISPSFGKGSPLEFLLEPAHDEDEHESGDDSHRDISSLPSRSMSSDSMYSATPSLNTDEELMMASPPSISSPPTPTCFRRPSRFDRKEKLAMMSSPPGTQCDNHPLLPSIAAEDSEAYPSSQSTSPTPLSKRNTKLAGQQSKHPSSLKSNLTASLQAIKSAARAFSNFTAPSLPSDDFLTRSLFSTRYAPEMRPRHSAGDMPDASLRRYLNPTPPAIHSSAVMTDYHALLTDSMWRETSSNSTRSSKSTLSNDSLPRASSTPGRKASSGTGSSPMIQLQTYVRVGRSPSPSLRQSRRNSSPLPPLPPPERAESPIAALGPDGALAIIRQREPRENSDFLRVIVLEMNMRRVGKLDTKAAGRARVWLPPRKNSVVIESVGGNAVVNPGAGVVQVAAAGLEKTGRKVPERWIGVRIGDA